MPAYSTPINRQCEHTDCPRFAVATVFNTKGVPVGKFCIEHSEMLVEAYNNG